MLDYVAIAVFISGFPKYVHTPLESDNGLISFRNLQALAAKHPSRKRKLKATSLGDPFEDWSV